MKLFFIWAATSFITWQLLYFFVYDCGRIQRWRLRRALDNIVSFIKDNTAAGRPPIELTFCYKNKKFGVGVLEKEIEYSVYKTYEIFINGDAAAKLHCLEHLFSNSYRMVTVNNRHEDEIIKIIHACNKYLKKLEKELNKDKVPEWKANSYFN